MNRTEMMELVELWDEALAGATGTSCCTSLCCAYNWIREVRSVIEDATGMTPIELKKHLSDLRNSDISCDIVT